MGGQMIHIVLLDDAAVDLVSAALDNLAIVAALNVQQGPEDQRELWAENVAACQRLSEGFASIHREVLH